MDYSASINAGEDPAGASPWGSSPQTSPPHNRPAFASEPPPFAYVPDSSNGLGPAGEHAGGFQSPSATASEPADANHVEPGAAEAVGGSNAVDEPVSESGRAASQQPSHAASAQAQPELARHLQKPAQPQYRLQAKITGLERTGKKDPVLRFDVHVRARAASPEAGCSS